MRENIEKDRENRQSVISMDNDRKDLAWDEIKTEHIVKDEWIDFRKSAYRFPDGSVFEPFYSYSRRNYVVIVASDTEGRFICVRQFRQGIKEVTTEFPAGGLERKDRKEYGSAETGNTSEDPLSAAKRELLEETGYESEEWTHLLTVPSNATIADNYAYLYMAENCRRVSGQNGSDSKRRFSAMRPHNSMAFIKKTKGLTIGPEETFRITWQKRKAEMKRRLT